MSDTCFINNANVGSINSCTGKVEYGFYDYNPQLWNCALFVALFAVTTLAHLFQAIKGRQWYMLATVLMCGACEILGWSGRLWSNRSIEWAASEGGYWNSNKTAFLMQISTLIFAPAFLAAFWYIVLGRIIRVLGPQYSKIKPLTYTIFFICGDLASLTIQGIGGGLASGATTLEAANNGAKIMVAGVISQMTFMVFYTILLFTFVYCYLRRKPVKQFRFRQTQPFTEVPTGRVPPIVEHKAKILLAAMLFSTTLIFVRSIYRTIELLDGWHGPIIANETLFWVLDAIMVFLAMATFNFIHPNQFLTDAGPTASMQTTDEKEYATHGQRLSSGQSTPAVV